MLLNMLQCPKGSHLSELASRELSVVIDLLKTFQVIYDFLGSSDFCVIVIKKVIGSKKDELAG
jgi:hypothetical protein